MLSKADTLCRLRNEILTLQGFRLTSTTAQTDFGLDTIVSSFPNHTFPFSALHDFICESPQEVAASGAFVTGLLCSILKKEEVGLWVGTRHLIFPPALKSFGVDPDQIIFINTRNEKETIWTVEEALRSCALTCVVGQIRELSFTESRRFQLAIEQGGVGCFLLRYCPRNLTTAATTRWHIKPLSSSVEDEQPGVGYPRWQVNLLKVRGGKPGSWTLEWKHGRFHQPSKISFLPQELQKKTG
jgi:protein ImuA